MTLAMTYRSQPSLVSLTPPGMLKRPRIPPVRHQLEIQDSRNARESNMVMHNQFSILKKNSRVMQTSLVHNLNALIFFFYVFLHSVSIYHQEHNQTPHCVLSLFCIILSFAIPRLYDVCSYYPYYSDISFFRGSGQLY